MLVISGSQEAVDRWKVKGRRKEWKKEKKKGEQKENENKRKKGKIEGERWSRRGNANFSNEENTPIAYRIGELWDIPNEIANKVQVQNRKRLGENMIFDGSSIGP